MRARDEGDDMLLLDSIPRKKPRLSKSPSQAAKRRETSKASKPLRKKVDDSDSETEPESEPEELLLAHKSKLEPSQDEEMLPTPERSVSPAAGPAPGMIIGTGHPLDDFRKNLKQGDIVSKAVEDLGYIIKEIVTGPGLLNRTDEMLECMKEFRRVALEVSATHKSQNDQVC